jgi:glycosyltransferase involved in cell wall biosynthesis
LTRLVFLVNDAKFFLSHRLPIAAAAVRAGYDVHLACPESDATASARAVGIQVHQLRLERGLAPAVAELRTLGQVASLYRRLRPTIVHHVTVKPVLYGSLMARVTGAKAVVNAISGLGFAFLDEARRARLRRQLILSGYRLGFKHPRLRVIFQNVDDRELFLNLGVLRADQTVFIRGSGVDLATFQSTPEPSGPPVVMLASRMLWHKGVGEFVAAATQLRAQGFDARFVLVGDTDLDNPAAVPPRQLEAWACSGVIEWWGPRGDMHEVLPQASIVCLPSYREGLPKVLQEAAACGRPIVTTDAPGCREVVRADDNGLLVPVADSKTLATALARLLLSPDDRRRMGRRSREIAESEFGVDLVVARTLEVYRELADDVSSHALN